MSEEEKRAIEILKEYLNETHRKFCSIGAVGIPNEEYFAIETILNLIKNQQKELNSLKEIEKSHKEENEKLRVELEQEKEKNTELRIQISARETVVEELQEKNNELEIELSTRDNINVDKLVEKYRYYRRLADSYQANCISKEKIKEKIKEREHIIHNAKLKYGQNYDIYDDVIYARQEIKLYKELLEEK